MKFLRWLSFASALTASLSWGQDTLLEFDFSGSTNTADFNTQNSTFNEPLILSSTITRGAGVGNNNAGNSFRGQGFSNLVIDVASDRYFEWTMTAASGFQFSVTSIYSNFNGTASFAADPGVTVAYAYSLDGGSTFNLLDPFTQIGTGNRTYTIGAAAVPELTDITQVTFRFFSSGQTTTGGWGLQSAATPGTIGLSVDGFSSAIPESSTYAAMMGVVALAWVVYLRRRR